MSYLGELRQHARPLSAASLGGGVSLPFFAYTNTVFSPHLIREFGWSRAQFALVGLTMLATLLVLPFIGRFTDRLGVRRIALFGTLLLPLCFGGYAMQQGSFGFFLLCSTLVLMIGAMTSPLVYSRLIAENFRQAQGLALTIMNCVPALLAIPAVPLLNWVIDTYGWRAGYLGLGGFVLIGGLIALLLVPAKAALDSADQIAPDSRPDSGPQPGDFALILRSKVFWIIFAGMFLCVLQTPLHAAQMNLMLMENGLTTKTAASVVSIYAAGTIIGRIGCGLALDRYPTHLVTAISMGFPAIGYFLLATDLNTMPMVVGAMFLVGISVGAESDLLSFLVARYFKLRIYNTTLSLLFVCSFAGSACGALAISGTLRLADSYSPFMYLVAVTITLGCLLFLMLPHSSEAERVG